jgi:hypothetical protein
MKTGGYAFPCKTKIDGYNIDREHTGMTLRQWYAGMAMQGMISAIHTTRGSLNEDLLSKEAFQFADAMIKAEESKRVSFGNGWRKIKNTDF